MKTINLQGEWQLFPDQTAEGVSLHYYEKDTCYPERILLPSTISEVKIGEPKKTASTDHLSEPYAFEGFAWYRKEIQLPQDCQNYMWELYLERTRMTEVYINGRKAGSFDSLCTPHIYDVSEFVRPGNNLLVILVKNTGYPTKGGHMTSPDTQTNWNGLLGKLELRPRPFQHLVCFKISSSCKEQSLTLEGKTSLPGGELLFQIFPDTDSHRSKTPEGNQESRTDFSEADTPILESTCAFAGTAFSHRISLDHQLSAWSEYEPVLYILKTTLKKDGQVLEEDVKTFGLRDFTAGEERFFINGLPTFLRGKHDGMVFPLTGYAPMDVEGWMKVMKTAKDYGINHYRFHTCCPPEAAFEAADRLGIYLQPELPFWGTITEPGEEGHDEAMQQYLIAEGFRILDSFGNHPSFVMFSLGNELWGSQKVLSRILRDYKAYDSRHLYVQGSNNFQFVPCILPEDDFFSGVRFDKDRLIRGSYAMCDAPLGHIQTRKPATDFDYDEAIYPGKKAGTSHDAALSETAAADKNSETPKTRQIQYGTGVKEVALTEETTLLPSLPVVSHEIGQYETYPDFSEIEKYTGVLKAENLRIFRKRLEKAGLLPLADAYFHSSGHLAAACYKEELETALRSDLLAGYQLLDLQDFPGQRIALVGILNAFMENKGIITQEAWNQFCAPVVVMASFPDYVQKAGASVPCKILLSNYGKDVLKDALLTLRLTSEIPFSDTVWYEKTFRFEEASRGLSELTSLSLPMPETGQPAGRRLSLRLSWQDISADAPLKHEISNSYLFWVYPETETKVPEDIVVAHSREELKEALSASRKILFLPSFEANQNSIEGTYCTDFWCYPMFRSISESVGKPLPVGTLGLLIQESHPALKDFPCLDFSTPQWWDIVSASRSTILDTTDILPIAQTIDNFERNHRLGLIYEVDCEGSHVLICTVDLTSLSSSLPADWLLKSLLSYLEEDFAEDTLVSLSREKLLSLFTES